ncbi:MAG: R3H domain-containing nucleic acid-binding protein [Vulcanimicrobiaceae bacterium]
MNDEHDGRPVPGDDPSYGRRRRASRSGPAGPGPSRGPDAGAPKRRPPPRIEREPRVAVPEPESARAAHELLETILVKMGVTGTEIVYHLRSEGEYLEVRGPDLANLIGRHGHTLEALNLIFNNILNVGVKKDRHYYTIDAEGYRARRADQLRGVALQTLERAIREKRPIPLDPMLPSERKIIHLALAENPFVTTESSGIEPERFVIVSPRSA